MPLVGYTARSFTSDKILIGKLMHTDRKAEAYDFLRQMFLAADTEHARDAISGMQFMFEVAFPDIAYPDGQNRPIQLTKPIRVMVNGNTMDWMHPWVSHEQICLMLGLDKNKATVSWHAEDTKGGILDKSGATSMMVFDGLIIETTTNE